MVDHSVLSTCRATRRSRRYPPYPDVRVTRTHTHSTVNDSRDDCSVDVVDSLRRHHCHRRKYRQRPSGYYP
jgi:hypothetical protein